MDNQNDLRSWLKPKANEILQRLTATERETLLIKCWMSHDARWFMAVANEYGIPVANRLNQIAAHAVGAVEAQRIVRALQLPPIATLDDYILAQEIFIQWLGPDLLDYQVSKVDATTIRLHVRRCFAYDNAVRAKIADDYECGIFARVTGWLDALSLPYTILPALGKCLKAQGHECAYAMTINTQAKE